MQRITATNTRKRLGLHYQQLQTGHYFIYRFTPGRGADNPRPAVCAALTRHVVAGLLHWSEAGVLAHEAGRMNSRATRK